jgi:hypothetical protein
MFYAFIIVCAAFQNFEVNLSRCIEFRDILGPYQTLEQCSFRVREMISFINSTENLSIVSTLLNKPPLMYFEGNCIENIDYELKV